MTDLQKKQIESLRENGYSYSAIAEELGISENTIKSYFRRSQPPDRSAANPVQGTQCLWCGRPITQTAKQKPKRFCSDDCRVIWWGFNRNNMKKKATYIIVCEGCGREFESYGNRNRKYCNTECFMDARFRKKPII